MIDKYIIIPAIIAYKKAIKVSVTNGARKSAAIIAPINSDIPDINVYKNAFNLLPVA